ncbi:MAG: hypothetical protein IT343_17515 [Candidatus Melainabacteria bacterium]|jgi:hypothetical protein|nr:hypothetical protein [Candidatus Melainabacteria bacterium]
MENATKTSCDDAGRANFANRLLSRALTERRRPDTVSSRIFGSFSKNVISDSQSQANGAKLEDDGKVLAGAGKR